MKDFIVKYWVQELMAAIVAAMGFLANKVRVWKQKQDLVTAGVLALLHDRLYQACQFYLKRGYCTLEDRDNLEYMFRPYKAWAVMEPERNYITDAWLYHMSQKVRINLWKSIQLCSMDRTY